MLPIITMILIVLLSILFLVVIHELGHFWVARWYGIAVEKFSVGFGPHLFSYTDRKTGTKWCLSAIPLGGYVKFYNQREEAPFGQLAFEDAPALSRLAVAVAGPLFNLLFAFIVILTFNYQQGTYQAVIAKPLPDSALFKAGITEKTRIQAIGYDNQIYPVQSFQELMRHVEAAAGGEQNIILQDQQNKNYFINYFDMTNIVKFPSPKNSQTNSQTKPATTSLASALTSSHTAASSPSPSPVNFGQVPPSTKNKAKYTPEEFRFFSDERLGLAAPITSSTIESVKKNEAAEFLGLKAGQKIVSINNIPFNNHYLWANTRANGTPFTLGVEEASPSTSPETTGNSKNSKPIIKQINIDAAALEKQFANSPLNTKNKAVQKELAEKMKLPDNALPSLFVFGFTMQNSKDPAFLKANQPWQVFTQSLEELMHKTLAQFSGMMNSIFGLQTENMSSVVGISQILSDSAEASTTAFFSILALLSIGLACVNLLPIPLLDGWHMLTALIEVVFKRPLPRAVNDAFHRFGLMFLLFIFLSTVFQDIFKLAN